MKYENFEINTITKLAKEYEGKLNYYQILGILPEEATDDIVERIYEAKKDQTEIVLENTKNECVIKKNQIKVLLENLETQYKIEKNQIQILLQDIENKVLDIESLEKILTYLQDAYFALRTELSRKNYDEILEKIKKDEERNEADER